MIRHVSIFVLPNRLSTLTTNSGYDEHIINVTWCSILQSDKSGGTFYVCRLNEVNANKEKFEDVTLSPCISLYSTRHTVHINIHIVYCKSGYIHNVLNFRYFSLINFIAKL